MRKTGRGTGTLAGTVRGLAALAPAVLLAACGSAVGTALPEPAGSDVRVERGTEPPRNHCDADAAASAVGTAWTAALLGEIRMAAGADEARMLHADSVITKEYKLGRVNVVVGADGRVQRVYCG